MLGVHVLEEGFLQRDNKESIASTSFLVTRPSLADSSFECGGVTCPCFRFSPLDISVDSSLVTIGSRAEEGPRGLASKLKCNICTEGGL